VHFWLSASYAQVDVVTAHRICADGCASRATSCASAMRQAHRSLREVQELWMGVFGGVLSGTGAIETLWLVNVSGHGGEVVGTFVEM
jgi:hypothetical protein